MEEIIARIDYDIQGEAELKQEATALEITAKQYAIVTAQDYESAITVGRTIKEKMGKIIDFFKPIKDAAHKAHKAICDKETEALEPLKRAETSIKAEATKYLNEQERKRREAEAALRKKLAEEEAARLAEAQRIEAETRKIQEEKNRQLAEAARLEAEGNRAEAEKQRRLAEESRIQAEAMAAEAEATLNEAVSMESLGMVATVQSEAPKVQGAAVKKDYEIRVIEMDAVPIKIMGAIIRPVDEAAIKRLVKATNGTVRIPGVQIIETANIALRR